MLDSKVGLASTAARYIAGSQTRAVPADVLDFAKMCLADWFAVGLGAMNESAAVHVNRVVATWDAHGPAQTLYGARQPPAFAALVNATLTHCLDYDDVHFPSLAHLSSPTWAATLSLAATRHDEPMQLLRAFIAGFEIGGRLGANGVGEMVLDRGWHVTGVVGRLAATAASCALLKLETEQIEQAIGIACTQTSGLTGSFGTDSKPLHAGKAAFDGIFSTQLAASGFRGAIDLLDRKRGLIDALVQDNPPKMSLGDLEQTWELRRNALKPYACCGLTHAAIDSARQLAHTVKGRAISSVDVQVHPLTLKVADKKNVVDSLAAKFSIGFCTALGLSGYQATAIDFSQERIADKDLLNLAGLVHPHADPGMAASASKVTVLFTDGSTVSHHTEVSLGNPQNPMTWDDLREKFMALVEPVLGTDSLPLFDRIRRFETLLEWQEIWTPIAAAGANKNMPPRQQ